MKGFALILLLMTFTSANCQLIENEREANIFGVGMGLRSSTGIFGATYGRSFAKRFEAKSYIGIRYGLVVSAGLNTKILSKKSIETALSFDYSYCFSGDLTFEESNNTTDNYEVSDGQFLNFYLTTRFFPKQDFCIQLCLGYSNSISNQKIYHKFGPNKNQRWVEGFAGEGLLIELGLLFPFGR